MRIKSLILFTLFVCLFLAVPDPAMSFEGKTPTIKEILDLKYPGSPKISPDGKYVLFTDQETDWEGNEYTTQIWLVEISSGDLRQMTYAKKSSHSPEWSPDGMQITFLSSREEKPQVYIMSAIGGEARRLTNSPTGVNGYQWSPDGKHIAFTAADEESERQKAIEKKFGKFEIVDLEFSMSRLWVLDLATKQSEKIVDRENLHVGSMDWSPDGTMIAFSATPDPRAESWSKSDIYIVNVTDKEIRSLVNQPGSDANPLWSPDGKTIAYNSSYGKEEWFLNDGICTIPVEGGEIRALTKDFDENAALLAWKNNVIFFTAFQGMSRHLFKIDLTNKEIAPITEGDGLILWECSFTKHGSRMAFVSLDALHFQELYHSETDHFQPKKLTHYSDQMAEWSLSVKEKIKWKSKDGAEVTGVLIKPADFNPEKKYPLLVIIHGGPSSISMPQYLDRMNRYYPIEQWVAKGAVILEPNYRGSTGFGEDFRKLNYRNLGVGDYWDVISGVDYLVSQGFVDNNLLGAMGWSQGGYISAFITTFSDRFKAVSVGAGISDWVTYYVNTDIHPFTRVYLGATPWEDEEVYRKTSPMTYINNAKTPTLIQHGEFDLRVPIPNAFKLYQGLQDKGVPVKFVIYKGFGHGITKPRENLAVLTHNFQWFNKYIWGEEPPEEELEIKEEKEKK
ncbi:MAG: S9 family peptidase [Candidatus Aminicenantes bacterium]|nr:S9 family peptidase [Candidatus Aminicenantes bacterium]